MNERSPCPNCGSHDVAPILYGLPAQEGFDAAERGEVILGGCEPYEASHGCRKCGTRWTDEITPDQMTGISDASMRIADTFNAYFRNWSIEVTPEDVRPGNRDLIGDRGWRINYLVDTDREGHPFLEFYATHRMTDDRHVLISSSGDMEDLDAINGMVMYDPNVGGSRERAGRDNIERNRRVADELKAKGLFPSGNINAFLRMGGMEASDALKEMEGLLTEAGLSMPPIPEELQDKMRGVRRWCYATRDVDPFEMYMFDRYLLEAVSARPEEYFAFSHAGHGITSYAITYQLVIRRLALFVQVPWGGVYMDKERQASAVRQMFGRCAEFLGLIPDLPEGPQLLVAVSELRRHRLCGWIPPGLDEEGARRWLRSEELSVEDPFHAATKLLREAETG